MKSQESAICLHLQDLQAITTKPMTMRDLHLAQNPRLISECTIFPCNYEQVKFRNGTCPKGVLSTQQR